VGDAKESKVGSFLLSIDGIELLLIGCSVVVLCSKVQKSAEIEGTACRQKEMRWPDRILRRRNGEIQ